MPENWPFRWGERTYIMAVLNVTPDSFSGDGILTTGDEPGAQARVFQAAGADLLDIGGESTRPGHVPVGEDVELERTLPAIRAAREIARIALSVDTRKAAVARQAISAGARVVNDVSGLSDPEMASVVAETNVGLIIVHSEEVGDGDIVKSIGQRLESLTEKALKAGISAAMVAVDPGLGFAKTWRQNLEILKRLGELRLLGFPLVIGPSRKATISRVLGVDRNDRLEGTAAAVAVGIAHGADVVRVHDVHFMREVARMTDSLAR